MARFASLARRIEDARIHAAVSLAPPVVIEEDVAGDGDLDEVDHDLVLWHPHPENIPQQRAFASMADDTGYGGAAGGGKTDLGLGLAFTAHRRSLIFRRDYTQHAENIDRMKEIARVDEGVGVWSPSSGPGGRFAVPGRVVALGAMQREADWSKWMGRPFDLIFFDQLEHFTPLQFRILTVWNRTTIPGQRCRVVASFNPPTEESQLWLIDEFAPWVDPRFERPAEDGEIRYYIYNAEDRIQWVEDDSPVEISDGEGGWETVEPRSRTFFHARLDDNPPLASTGYGKKLDALPREIRKAFKKGIFSTAIREDPTRVIPARWVEAAFDLWRELHATALAETGAPFEPGVPMTALGVDPSRGGKDETAFAPRYGDYIAGDEKNEIPHAPGVEVPRGSDLATLVIDAIDGEDEPRVVINDIGVGSSPFDILEENGVDVYGFTGSRKAVNSKGEPLTDKSGKYKFASPGALRGFAWWRFREMLDPESSYEIALPPDSRLKRQLCAPRWKITASGIRVEPSEAVAKRLGGESPDRAEAVIYAFFEPTEPGPAVAATSISAQRQASKISQQRRAAGVGSKRRGKGGKRW